MIECETTARPATRKVRPSQLKPGQEFHGTYLKSVEEEGAYRHKLRLASGELLILYGCAQLNRAFVWMMPKSKVRIRFLGKKVLTKGRHKGAEQYEFNVNPSPTGRGE